MRKTSPYDWNSTLPAQVEAGALQELVSASALVGAITTTVAAVSPVTRSAMPRRGCTFPPVESTDWKVSSTTPGPRGNTKSLRDELLLDLHDLAAGHGQPERGV